MKRFIKVSLLLLVVTIGLVAFDNYPGNADPKPFQRLSDTTNILRCLQMVVNTLEPRYVGNTDMLDTVAKRIHHEFSQHTNDVSFQNYTADNKQFRNVIASFGPENARRIIIGAHYDVCRQQDGADDNASGVAGILELARLLRDQPLKYRVDLVAYSTEEPPYFGTKNMGSYVHAKSLRDANVPVFGMISMEMIGYFSDEERSQRYPVGMLKWFYGDKGDFITVVQKSFSGKFARQFKRASLKNNSINTKAFKAPAFFGGISLSDHRSYWHFGYSAVMVTNTSFFRNSNYHTVGDKIETLDIDRMALVIDGVFRSVVALK